MVGWNGRRAAVKCPGKSAHRWSPVDLARNPRPAESRPALITTRPPRPASLPYCSPCPESVTYSSRTPQPAGRVLERPPRKAGPGGRARKKENTVGVSPGCPAPPFPALSSHLRIKAAPAPRAPAPSRARRTRPQPFNMASSAARQDAKHERALKALLKLPDNRRCADCDTLVSRRKKGGAGVGRGRPGPCARACGAARDAGACQR